MSILLLNCGSSSIKYQVIGEESQEVLAKGLVERIGLETGIITHEVGDDEFVENEPFEDHTAAITTVVGMFAKHGPSLDEVKVVGHRTVHGGDTFREPTLINDAVIEKLRDLSGLAPLHNPPGLAGIEAALKILPDVPHVAIFDTAFFGTLPPEAYTYAIKREVTEKYGVRKYGFHGTSHQYVSQKAAEHLGTPLEDLKVITLHLGNGASISAIEGGRAVETSMGFTPLQGLVMGTRSGDVDPGLHAFLVREGWSLEDIDTMLNKQSGMLGLCGLTDMRDVDAAIQNNDADAKLAADIYVHRLVSYIGSYWALMGGLDVIVFTAGIGENAVWLRKLVMERLTGLGITLDDDANAVRSKDPRAISGKDSKVQVLVVPTNEELAMALQSLELVNR